MKRALSGKYSRPALLAAVAVATATPSFAAEVGQRFRSVGDFLKSMPPCKMSHDLLTGAVVIHFAPHEHKAVTKALALKPALELLDDKFGSDAGGLAEFSKYAGC